MRKESYFKGSQKEIKTGALKLKLSNEKKIIIIITMLLHKLKNKIFFHFRVN